MVLTAGVLSQISVGSNSAKLSSTSATSGTAPYTQQWYRDTSGSGFTPGAGNLIAGATALTLDDINLIPNTVYYYKVKYTDSAPEDAAAVVTSLPLTVTTTAPSLSQNQFTTAPFPGLVDLMFSKTNVVAVQIDDAQSSSIPLYGGQRVMVVAASGKGIPKVISNDEVFMPSGYIVFDVKSQQFVAGNRCEMAQDGTCLWLYATSAIDRYTKVCIDQYTKYGVQAITGSTTMPIVGIAYDEATAPGQLIRVLLKTPTFELDS